MSSGIVAFVAPTRGGAIIARSTANKNARDTLNRERVMRAAIQLADESGIDSLTMRELARRLGIEAASLYNHIAGKGDLLNGMADVALSEVDAPTEGVGWREAMRRRAISTREVFARHAWAARLIDSRDRRGQRSIAYVDSALGVLIRAGFSPARAANALLVLDSYIYGFERQPSTVPMEEGVEATEAARQIVAAIPGGAYPFALSVAAEYAVNPFDTDAAFEYGLDLFLDGLERSLGPE